MFECFWTIFSLGAPDIITTETSLISSAHFEHDGRYFVSRPSPRRANYPSWLRSQTHVHLSQQFVRKQAWWPPIFSHAFAKNSLIKNIFEEEKKFDRFLGENGFVFGASGEGEDFKLTTELSKRVQYPHNQAIKNELNEAILLISIKEALCSS